jgi:hypothetical protein
MLYDRTWGNPQVRINKFFVGLTSTTKRQLVSIDDRSIKYSLAHIEKCDTRAQRNPE